MGGGINEMETERKLQNINETKNLFYPIFSKWKGKQDWQIISPTN
jgi:hypothetical protein